MAVLWRGKEIDVKAAFSGVAWGEKSLVALYVSVLSGIVVALQYNPAEPLYSATIMDLLVPFGAFWRSLHFYSSQLFFLFIVCHLLAVLLDRFPVTMSFRKWLPLVCSLPVVVLVLFTGYVLRGDVTGEMAGFIAENIVLSVPVAGRWLNNLLFAISSDGMQRVYVNHLIGLGVLWGVLSWDHLRRYRVSWRQHGALLVALLVACLALTAPMETEHLGVFRIAGPWFFLGVQELLRYVPPVWAGVVFPLTLVVALCLLGSPERRTADRAVRFSLLWLGTYAILSLVMILGH